MTPLSNLHGRVLEYLITEVIIRTQPGVNLTVRANNAQLRDVSKLTDLKPSLLNELRQAANALLRLWLNPQFQLSQQPSITVDRLPDQNQNIEKLPSNTTWYVMSNYPDINKRDVGNFYGLRTWVEYGLKQSKNELG